VLGNREVESDSSERRESAGKTRRVPALIKVRKGNRAGRWLWEPGVGGRQPGGTDPPEVSSASSTMIRGSLQTKQAGQL